ncbi:hypothetical protein [Shewanella japonica]|uniref:hypothetical protein n=1 Tax=Shewanella japonica TaxID=93973 RepID=UPI0024951EC5|nr:hypothetical protein [Shewanella japonica]
MRKRMLFVCLLMPMMMTGCSSRSASNAGCDFVTGAYGNAKDREERESRSHRVSSSDNNKQDAAVGLFSAMFGALGRALNNDESSCI